MLTRRRLPWVRLLVGLVLVVGMMVARALTKHPDEVFWRLRGAGAGFGDR